MAAVESSSIFWLAWAIASPFAGSVLSFIWPRRGSAFGLAAISVMTVCGFELAAQIIEFGVIEHHVGGWGAPLGINFRADGLTTTMILMIALVGLGVSFYALGYFNPEANAQSNVSSVRFFWPLWLFLLGGLAALFATADLFNVYVTLEVISFAGVALVALSGGTDALRAAIRYLFVGLVGGLFYLLGFTFLYSLHGTADLTALTQVVTGTPVEQFAGIIMLLGLALKTALFPFHFWLPPAHASAPAPVSAALSGLVVKGSYYLILRLWFGLFGNIFNQWIAISFGILGAAAILVGSVSAWRQERVKLLVAYGTVAQLGYLFLVIPLASGGAGKSAWIGAIYFAITHAFAKSAMFLVAGNIIYAAGHDRITDLRGVAQVAPVTFLAFAMAGINAVGLPLSGGFMAKWLMMGSALESGLWAWALVLLCGGLLSAAYVMKVMNLAIKETDPNEPAKQYRPIPPIMEWTAFTLAAISIALGFWISEPVALLDAASPLQGPLFKGGAP